MKVLKSHEFTRQAPGGRKHDWTTLLDGQIRELEAEDMGAAKASTFVSQARNQAKKLGLSIHSQTKEDETGNVTVVLQAYQQDETNGHSETPKPRKAKAASA